MDVQDVREAQRYIQSHREQEGKETIYHNLHGDYQVSTKH
jgi:hypothetical protein